MNDISNQAEEVMYFQIYEKFVNRVHNQIEPN